MTNPAHVLETALLILAAYLLGCVIGYAMRRILHAGRGASRVGQPVPSSHGNAVVPLRKTLSPAARLAGVVDNDPISAPPIAAPSAKPKTGVKPTSKPSDPKPVALSKPRNGQADDLQRIKGIGPKIEAALHGLGIFHFDQIAGWNKQNIDWVDGQLAFKGRIRRENWLEQAAALAKDSS